MGKGIKRILEIVSEAIFPSNIYCICCGSLIDSSRSYSLCDNCIGKFHWITGATCDKCGKALPEEFHGNTCYDCMQREHHFDRGYSCLTYGFYERQVMMDFKYNNKGYLGEKLGDILYDRISLENLEIDVRTDGKKIGSTHECPGGQQKPSKKNEHQAAENNESSRT